MQLTAEERAMADGRDGPAVARAMDLLLRYARALGAERLVETRNVVASVSATTPFMREFARREGGMDAVYSQFSLDSDEVVDTMQVVVQALSARDDTAETVETLAKHPDFTLANPNRLRSLVGAFAANQRAFHDPSGRGYRFLADMILATDKLNPQTAARLVPPLGRWRRFGEARAALMKAELERIVATPGLSKDVFEQSSKSLG